MDFPTPTRVLIVDSRALLRAAWSALLRSRPQVCLVAEAATLEEAAAAAGREHPDVIVCHFEGEHGEDVAAACALATASPSGARLLLVVDGLHTELQRLALRHGAAGIVSSEHPAELLFKAIEKVRAGEAWIERRLVADVLGPENGEMARERARIATLTPREREVVRLIGEGLKNKQIADRLTVTDITVRHHLTSVFSKLGVPDRLALLIYASRHGLGPSLDRANRHV